MIKFIVINGNGEKETISYDSTKAEKDLDEVCKKLSTWAEIEMDAHGYVDAYRVYDMFKCLMGIDDATDPGFGKERPFQTIISWYEET